MNRALPAKLTSLLSEMRRRADDVDVAGSWPLQDLDELRDAGIFSAAVAAPLGAGLPALEQHLIYEAIARASLAVALILSQRDAAIGLIDSSVSAVRAVLLEQLAKGAFTTVGIAQLTTSRQGSAPALRAVAEPDGYRVDGLIPWCTGAAKAAFIVAGAATDDGRKLLFIVRPESAGVKIDPPLPLVALRSTWTTAIRCDGVRIPSGDVLSGPAEKVLVRSNHLPLGQAFLATGLCRGALDLIGEHRSPAAQAAAKSFESQLSELRQRILDLSQPGREPASADAASEIRGRCNDLAVRMTHAAVALYKGTALLAGHPAQRLAREAMFLLVWSCPNPVIDCTVEMLSNNSHVPP
jgi:alkylation response protein AidB-like acyl-CoA dehydrogenase